MLIAAGSAAAAAAFVAWRAPRKPVVAESPSPPPTTAHRPKGHEMKPVTVRVTVPEGR
jgi:hypothetical protein